MKSSQEWQVGAMSRPPLQRGTTWCPRVGILRLQNAQTSSIPSKFFEKDIHSPHAFKVFEPLVGLFHQLTPAAVVQSFKCKVQSDFLNPACCTLNSSLSRRALDLLR